MVCYYCNHPLAIPQPQFKRQPRVGDSIPLGAVQDVKCVYCGSVYEITVMVKEPTKLSTYQLYAVTNITPPSIPIKATSRSRS